MTRIIFINRYFHPDHSATSQMLSDVAFELRRGGHDVTVITSRQRYDAPNEQLLPSETIDGVGVHRIWTTRFGRQNLTGRALDYATFYMSCAVALLRLIKTGDIVIAKTDPPMLSVLAYPIVRFKRAHLVNWLQDIFPEVAEALGMGRSSVSRRVFSLLRRLRDSSLRAATFNVVLGERMKSHLLACGVPAQKIRIIPNFADAITPVPHADNPIRKTWNLEDDFVVAYSGNLGRAHDYAAFLDAIVRLEAEDRHARRQDPSSPSPTQRRITWLFIGGGALLEPFKTDVAKRGLTSVRFEPYQPRALLSQSLSAGDVHLVSLRPELEGLIVPSKFYGIAAAGRATIFIGSKDGEIARLLNEHDCGIAVDEGDGQDLAQAIKSLCTDANKSAAMGANARSAFEANWDKNVVVRLWHPILIDVQL